MSRIPVEQDVAEIKYDRVTARLRHFAQLLPRRARKR
jgi:hypothetical protein